MCPPSKNGHRKASKNGMNRSISWFYERLPHLFHGLLDNEPLPIRLKCERTKQPQGRFAPAQAYHIGSSLSSDFRGINAQQVLVCKRRQPIKHRLRPYGIVICLDIWKYISLRCSSCPIVLMMYKFTFETTEKVFCYGVIIWITLSWYALSNAMFC